MLSISAVGGCGFPQRCRQWFRIPTKEMCFLRVVCQFWFPSGKCCQSRVGLHMVCVCLCHRRVVFLLRVCVLRQSERRKKEKKNGFESEFSLAMLGWLSSMMIVFPFGGVAFYEAGCGSASLSATETLRTQAAQLTVVAYSMSVVTTPSLVLVRN